MAAIIEKAFDATKRIVRTVFKGSPNLFTTSDVNRQIEALKYQLDQLDGRVGAQSDMTISAEESQNTQGCIDITVNFSYLDALGVSFAGLISVPRVQQDIPFSYDTPVYLCLRYTTTEIAYSDDPTHTISGAKFTDNTSSPAANNIVVNSAFLDTSEQPENEQWDNCIVLASIVVDSDDNINIRKNYTYKGDPILLKNSATVENLLVPSSLSISIGDTLTLVANKLRTFLDRLFPSVSLPALVNFANTYQRNSWDGTVYTVNNKCRVGIRNGFLIVNLLEEGYPAGGHQSDFDNEESGGSVAALGCIRDNNIISVLNKFKTSTSNACIDFGVVGYTHVKGNQGEADSGNWNPIRLQVLYRAPQPYTPDTSSEWVVQLKMVGGVTLAYSEEEGRPVIIDDPLTRYWSENNGSFIVERALNIYPLTPFIA